MAIPWAIIDWIPSFPLPCCVQPINAKSKQTAKNISGRTVDSFKVGAQETLS
jgi:hypothetical protein